MKKKSVDASGGKGESSFFKKRVIVSRSPGLRIKCDPGESSRPLSKSRGEKVEVYCRSDARFGTKVSLLGPLNLTLIGKGGPFERRGEWAFILSGWGRRVKNSRRQSLVISDENRA